VLSRSGVAAKEPGGGWLATDSALAESARRGSKEAFSLLVTRYRNAIHVIVRNMFVSPREASEVTRQIFLSMHHDLSEGSGKSSFAISLYRLAIEMALERRARDRSAPPCSLEAFLPRYDKDGHVVLGRGSWALLDDRAGEAMEVTPALREAMDCMEDRIRAAFILRDLVALDVDDVAAVLQVPADEVVRRVHRARLMLRGLLDRLL
jgi:RNA polymerase sigma-70 factor (ECF subfamily)